MIKSRYIIFRVGTNNVHIRRYANMYLNIVWRSVLKDRRSHEQSYYLVNDTSTSLVFFLNIT